VTPKTSAGSSNPSISAKKPVKVTTIKGVDSKLVSLIQDEIVDGGASVSFDDIAGLQVEFIIVLLKAKR
jgi:hypothetical protein